MKQLPRVTDSTIKELLATPNHLMVPLLEKIQANIIEENPEIMNFLGFIHTRANQRPEITLEEAKSSITHAIFLVYAMLSRQLRENETLKRPKNPGKALEKARKRRR